MYHLRGYDYRHRRRRLRLNTTKNVFLPFIFLFLIFCVTHINMRHNLCNIINKFHLASITLTSFNDNDEYIIVIIIFFYILLPPFTYDNIYMQFKISF